MYKRINTLTKKIRKENDNLIRIHKYETLKIRSQYVGKRHALRATVQGSAVH